MNCKNCGNQIKEGNLFCNNCGTKIDIIDGENTNILTNMTSKNSNVKQNKSKLPIVIGFICIIILIFIVILLLPKKEIFDDNTNNNQDTIINETVSKIYSDKNYVYDIFVEVADEFKTYTASDGTIINVDDYKFPFVNIDSENAKGINNDVALFMKYYENKFNNKENPYKKANYEFYINDNILSILFYEKIINSSADKRYVYNIDINTGKSVTKADLFKAAGYTVENIDSAVKKSIKSYTSSFQDENIKYFEEKGGRYYLGNNKSLYVCSYFKGLVVDTGEQFTCIEVK